MDSLRRFVALAVALAAVVLLLVWGAWLVLLRASEPARTRPAGYAERQQLGPGQLLLLGLVALAALVLLALTKRP